MMAPVALSEKSRECYAPPTTTPLDQKTRKARGSRADRETSDDAAVDDGPPWVGEFFYELDEAEDADKEAPRGHLPLGCCVEAASVARSENSIFSFTNPHSSLRRGREGGSLRNCDKRNVFPFVKSSRGAAQAHGVPAPDVVSRPRFQTPIWKRSIGVLESH